MRFKEFTLSLIILITVSFTTFSQQSIFSKIEIISDTSSYNSIEDIITIAETKKLLYSYTKASPVVEIKLYPQKTDVSYEILPSGDYKLVDSLIHFKNFSRVKIQFNDINKSDLLRLSFKIKKDTSFEYEELHLQPFTKTTASIRPGDNLLYIGEEKTFEVFSNNTANLILTNEWVVTPNADYRFSSENGKVLLHIIPKKLGLLNFSAVIKTQKPFLNDNHELNYSSGPVNFTFNVKSSRLKFLGIDKNEITYDKNTQLSGIEVQLENSNSLIMQKTYRIEAQEEAGGALIAELFTKQRISNNRVLCVIRPYNFHRSSEGYLFIKEGDKAKFITNFSITPATQIDRVSILREGKEWKESLLIYPGETFDIKLEGKGLHKAQFHFEDLLDITRDTVIKSETFKVFKLQAPVDISKKRIAIFNHSASTGLYLRIAEYQKPRDFDFIFMNYGDIGRRISGIKEPVLYEKVVKDLTLSFNTNKIDDEVLYGKQYIDIQVRITGKKNELVELKTIKNIAVCPSDNSPRHKYYGTKDCFNGSFSLNKYIHRPTYDLDDWSRISLTVSHSKDKHKGEGFTKEVEVILKRKTSFDIEVSFPAGLLTITPADSTESIGSLSGISMAMIAQFSFYHPEKINKYRPYKIGAGFLAMNAFNFNEKVDNRDVGLVILGSLYPTTRNTKLSFPLYVGGGYFLKSNKLFFLVGPGIRVRL